MSEAQRESAIGEMQVWMREGKFWSFAVPVGDLKDLDEGERRYKEANAKWADAGMGDVCPTDPRVRDTLRQICGCDPMIQEMA